MLKKIVQRAALGIVVGEFISYLVLLLISFIAGNGSFMPCAEAFASQFDSELTAVAVQFVLTAVMGGALGGLSLVWEAEKSIVWRSAVYFMGFSLAMFPTAYLCHWMEHTVKGVVFYVLEYVVIFIICWISMYLQYRSDIKKINSAM